MECPKCGAEIENNALVCPNCKKVLKIICPVCRTVNEKNVCRKCGEVLVVKCNNCGKINMMKNRKCIKCGYSTEISAVQSESNTDTFAVVKIEFPNYEVLKTALGSNQLFTKFKSNIDKIIYAYVAKLGVRRQIVQNGIYLLRFNKAYTMSSSAASAIETVIAIANIITKLNVKLVSKKNIILKCNFTIMKRDADKDPYDIDTGFQANMLKQSNDKSTMALDSCQVMTDDDFEEFYTKDYKLESLDSVLVNGKMKRFFEINIRDHINIEEFLKELQIEEEEANPQVPNFVNEGMLAQDKIVQRTIEEMNEIEGEKLYNVDLINFDEITCAFYSTDNIKILENIEEVLKEVPKGIIGIKGSNLYQPYTLRLLAMINNSAQFKNVVPITCNDNMRYTPYAFFRELVSSIFNYVTSQKLSAENDFSLFSNFDSENLINDLISLNTRDMDNLEDTRFGYFEVFLSLLMSLPQTLIFIENYDKMDSSSMFVLNMIFERFEDINISFILSYSKDFSVHKRAHFLLSRPYYTEITLTPTSFESIVKENEEYYTKIKTDFFFKRIAKYAAGSILFLDYAIQYLVESEVYAFNDDNTLELINPKTTMLPSKLEHLVARRLKLMKDDEDMLKFLSMCALIGVRIDPSTAESLGINNWREIAETLAQRGFIYYYNDCIYFPNYNILKESILSIYEEDELKNLANELLDKVYTEQMPDPNKAKLYEILDNHEKVISEWENLANLNLSLGDFSGYLNCSSELVKKLDQYKDDWSSEELQEYKTAIFTNISANMFEYNPEETQEIADKTLDDLEQMRDNQNFVDLAIKMVQGALEHGKYLYAQSMLHRLLPAMGDVSIDPAAQNFDLKYLLMLMIHVKVLFGTGAFKECVDIGYNILNVLDSSKLDMIEYTFVSREDFEDMVNDFIGYMALSNILIIREDVNELLGIVNRLFNFIPPNYSMFVKLQEFIMGGEVSVSEQDVGDDAFSNMLYHLIRAFTELKNDPVALAKEIYKTKIIAKGSSIYPFELFADLVIGYSYTELGSFYKARAILKEVLNSANDNGLNGIKFATFYVMSIFYMKQARFDLAYGMLNNSSIQMERLGGVSDYLMLLNKFNMYKLMSCLQVYDKADICLSQAQYIAEKYGMDFNFDFDIEKFIEENKIQIITNPEPEDTEYDDNEQENTDENYTE